MFRMSDEITRFTLKPLGECAEVLDRLRKPINSDERKNRQGDIPYYGANGQVGTIDEWIFDEELVLVAEDGGFFNDPIRPISYRVSGRSWVNNHAHVLRPINGMDIDWLNFAICHQDIRHLIKGATLKKLNQSDLKKILIPCPSIEEQRRIVARIKECMERVEEIENTRDSADAEFDSLIPASLEDIFHQNGFNETLLFGLLSEKPKNGVYLPTEFYVESDGVPMVRMGEMFRRFEVAENVESSIKKDKKLIKDYGLCVGDVLVARRSIVYEGSGSMAVVTK